jgi:hypothetical protein
VQARLGLLVAALLAMALLAGGTSFAAAARVAVAGPQQTVFDWSAQACATTQAADLPARAFRDDRGRVQLLLSHFDNFRLVGRSLARLRVDCRVVMSSDENAEPARFRDREWLAAPYTADGHRIWALVHDEYQGNRHPGRCPQGRYLPCWYNAITLAVSNDGGRSFHDPARGRLVAAPPYRYRPGGGPTGLFAPTNLVRHHDGYLYALVRFRDPDGEDGTCLMRSRQIWKAGGWRALGASGRFDVRFANPYLADRRSPTPCRAVSSAEIGEMAESLAFSSVLGEYILVGMAAERSGPRPRDAGVYFSTSDDLIHWSPRSLLLRAATVQTYRCGGASPIAYPSLLDPRSRSRTFAIVGRTPYLYFTQLHYRGCGRTPDRDLVRLPVEIGPGAHG